MSADSRRLLTHRRTRFRSSTNSERGAVVDDDDALDVTQHVYPIPRRAAAAAAAEATDQCEAIRLRPAGLVGLGFTMLFLGLHQCLCTYVL